MLKYIDKMLGYKTIHVNIKKKLFIVCVSFKTNI